MYVFVYLLKVLVVVVLLLMFIGGSVVGLMFDVWFVWFVYDWMGVVKVVFEFILCYFVCDFGLYGVCVNFVVVGLICIIVVKSIFVFEMFENIWGECVFLGWDVCDVEFIVWVCCVLFLDWFLVMMGEMVYVDGGVYVMG